MRRAAGFGRSGDWESELSTEQAAALLEVAPEVLVQRVQAGEVQGRVTARGYLRFAPHVVRSLLRGGQP
jgi:hypothetical protein